MRKLLLLACLALSLWGLDLSGNWSGVIEVSDPSGTRVNTPVRAHLEQKDATISGNIGRLDGQETDEIRNGKIEGDVVRFEVASGETTGALRFHLKVMDPELLEGEMKGAVETGPISGKVRLTKAK